MSAMTGFRPSPNHNERALPVSILVLHYTGMPRAGEAIDWLCNPASGVSAHWFVDEDGTVTQLVAEDRRAWHAGRSFWRGIADVNSASVGIEIQNPGHEWGYRRFPRRQMAALVPLVAGIVQRHGIAADNVVGHSDIAPTRKEDPGELFDWDLLARHRLAVARPRSLLPDPGWTEAGMAEALARYGYDVADVPAATRAFQRRFRQERVDGVADAETRAILATLLATASAASLATAS